MHRASLPLFLRAMEMDSGRKVGNPPTFWTLLMCLALASQGSFSTTPSHTFTRAKNQSQGVTRLDAGWTDTSEISCARKCKFRFNSICKSFMFNPKTGLCTPGSTISPFEPSPSPDEGTLYQDVCDTVGFSLKTFGKSTTCVGKFSQPVTYQQAEIECQNMGAFLVTVKTVEKLHMLLQTFGSHEHVWVGCDDRVSEGTYVWVEDGSSFTNDTKPANVFAAAQPDDKDGIEDCVAICPQKHSTAMLNDHECAKLYSFVCEMHLP